MSEEEINKIIEVYDEVIADLKQENSQLKERINMCKNINRKNKELNKRIEKAIEFIYITYQIISEQPSRNIEEDNFILSRLESFIEILKGDKE